MAAPYNDLLGKVELALKAVIDSLALDGLTVNMGEDDENLQTPYAVCIATEAIETDLREGGNYTVSAEVMVATSADTETHEAHKARVSAIFDKLSESDIATQLADAVEDFGVDVVQYPRQTKSRVERKWTTTQHLEIVCCAKDLV